MIQKPRSHKKFDKRNAKNKNNSIYFFKKPSERKKEKNKNLG